LQGRLLPGENASAWLSDRRKGQRQENPEGGQALVLAAVPAIHGTATTCSTFGLPVVKEKKIFGAARKKLAEHRRRHHERSTLMFQRSLDRSPLGFW
jgi:hypothetical protein